VLLRTKPGLGAAILALEFAAGGLELPPVTLKITGRGAKSANCGVELRLVELGWHGSTFLLPAVAWRHATSPCCAFGEVTLNHATA
jgi:hypothetical protein